MLVSIVIPDDQIVKIENIISKLKENSELSFSERALQSVIRELKNVPDLKLFNLLRNSYLNRVETLANKKIEKVNRTTVVNMLLTIGLENVEAEYKYDLPTFKQRLLEAKPGTGT